MWKEAATLIMRLLWFIATLEIIGAFFLPWVRLDGITDVYSGAEMLTIPASPIAQYLSSVSQLQTVVLVICPALILLSAAILATRYLQRKTAPLPTIVILASAVGIIYGASDLIATDGPIVHSGLFVVIVMSALLLVHQMVVILHARTRSKMRTSVDETLSIITGSGKYRWNDN